MMLMRVLNYDYFGRFFFIAVTVICAFFAVLFGVNTEILSAVWYQDIYVINIEHSVFFVFSVYGSCFSCYLSFHFHRNIKENQH